MKTVYYRIRAFAVKLLLRLVPRNQPVVFCGVDSSLALCRQVPLLGYSKLLIVTDSFLAGSGLLDPMRKTLSDGGVGFTLFDGVAPDPVFEQVRAGEALLRRERCQAVLAVGGGSVLDAGKMIALLHNNPGDLASFDGIQKAKHPGLTVFAVPTTAGTGSETTPAAVITDSKTKRKVGVADGKLVPHYVALDAGLTQTLPPRITAATGMDALTHAVESFLSRAATASSREMAVAAARLIFNNLPRAWRDGNDRPAREAMTMASFYAGIAFGRTSVGYAHGIAHQLGRVCGTPHGEANAMVLPEVLRAYGNRVRPSLADLARRAGLEAPGTSDAEAADALIERIADLRRDLALPLRPEGLEEKEVAGIVRAARAEVGAFYPVPRYLSAGKIHGIVLKLLPPH